MKSKSAIVLIALLLASLALIGSGWAADAPKSKGKPVARTVLCVFGFAKGDPTRSPVWPPDTFSAQMLQMSLEWLGYEMEFHDVGAGRPPEDLDPRFCAIILDSALEVPFAEQDSYLNWIVRQKEKGLKLLFVGGYPGDDKEKRQIMTAALGIRGSTEEMLGVKAASFQTINEAVLDKSLLAQPRKNGLVASQAPEGAKVHLAIKATDHRDIEMTCDVIYSAPWGGALLDPYLYFRTSPEDVRAVIDPFAFLPLILPAQAFPVPDSTTRDGLRMFLTHIDGDGFTTLTKSALDTTCAEIVRDQFLKHYPFPVTVSVIESDVKALLKDQDPKDRARYEEIAKTIFALPNVQAASHAWSHPFVWMPGRDIEGGRGYLNQWLEFADPSLYPAFDLKREIQGSVNYVQSTLLAPDKKVEVFLWSGNCRPSGEALSMVSALGLESMNGGNTTISRRAEGIAAISSSDTFMDGELQIYAPVQNEFTYTNGFTGPLYGGYRMVIDTFKRTEEPRRLKPVNVYYHFYSVQTGESTKALRDVHEWCLAQSLHSITVRDFALLAKDRRATRLTKLGSNRWMAENAGRCRTFRVSKALGVPNLAASEGVTGFNLVADQVYIHTSGKARTILDFSKAASPAQPYLVSSSGEITFGRLSAAQIQGSVVDLRDNEVILGGLVPGQTFDVVTTNGSNYEKMTARVDSAGGLRFKFPPLCGFSLTRVAK